MPKIAFTSLKLKHLPIPMRDASGKVSQVDYWDESQPGFGLRLSSSGDGSWMLMTRVLRQGRPTLVRVNLAPYGDPAEDPEALSLADARAKAAEALRRIRGGEDPVVAKRQKRERQIEDSKRTFGAVAALFLAKHCTKKRPATYRQYNSILTGPDFAEWRERPLASITRRDVRDVLEEIVERGAGISANRTLACLRKMMNWAVENDYLENAPTVAVKAPVPERPRDRHLFGDSMKNRPSEIALAWKAFEKLGPVNAAYLKLLLLTGQRKQELAHMRTDELFDLDKENPRWIIPGAKTKNGEEHAVPLSPLASELLRGIPRFEGCAHVFSLNGETPMNGFSKLKERIDRVIRDLKASGQNERQFTEPWTLHDLRRTFSTGLIELGVSESVVDLLTNHISGEARRGVRRHYNHARREKEKREAMLTWERHIRSLIAEDALPAYRLAA